MTRWHVIVALGGIAGGFLLAFGLGTWLAYHEATKPPYALWPRG